MTVKVEGRSFTLNQTITLGEPCEVRIRDFTMKTFRVTRMICNVPCPNFITLNDFQIDAELPGPLFHIEGVPVQTVDAYSFSATHRKNGVELQPMIVCQHGASVFGQYTGFVPSAYERGGHFLLCFTLMGIVV